MYHRALAVNAWVRHGDESANTKLIGREAEVRAMLQDGMSDAQIGRRLAPDHRAAVAYRDPEWVSRIAGGLGWEAWGAWDMACHIVRWGQP
jgi:hypothetical protein